MNDNVSPLIYTPPQPPAAPPTPPQYELKTDVTGLPSPVRGTQTINVLVPDKKTGQRISVPVQVPHLPKPSCRVCHGKGYVGFEIKSQKILFCHKCYHKNTK